MSNSKPLLGPCDSYQLEPFIYPWAWEMSRQQENNGWTPEEIQVGPDVADYKNPDIDPSHCELENLAMLTRRELVYFNNLLHAVPPARELRRALVARVKLLAAAHGRAEGLGMTPQQRRTVLGVMRRPERGYARASADLEDIHAR